MTRESVGRIDAQRVETALRAIRELMDERDKRYEERDRANKEAVRAALNASEKAAEKIETALKEYKSSSNEWRDTVKDLVGRMPTRSELDQHFAAIEEKIADLRDSRSVSSGRDTTLKQVYATHRWAIGIGVSVLLSVLVQILMFWTRTR